MRIEDIVRLPEPQRNVRAEIQEIVRDLAQRPHIFVRIRLSGWHFPQRAPEPFLVVGNVVSKFVQIGPDQTTADAYFDVRLPPAKAVSFGYGRIISWDFAIPVDPKLIVRLDRTRLAKGYVDLKP